MAAAGKSKLEVKKLTAPYLPPSIPMKDKVSVRVVAVPVPEASPLFAAQETHAGLKLESANKPESAKEPESNRAPVELRYGISFEADEELKQLFDQAEVLTGISRKAELLKKILKEFVNKKDPKKRFLKRVRVTAKIAVKRRAAWRKNIPAAVKDYVHMRDRGRCSYVGKNGVRCCATKYLQIDHIKPYGMGGSNETENLRLLCPEHNRFLAVQIFGKGKCRCFYSQFSFPDSGFLL